MVFFLKNCGDHFTFYKNDSLIKVSENSPLLAFNLKHAKLILKDLKRSKVKTDPFSVLGLSIFACSLDKKQSEEFILILLKLMNKKYDPFINTFNEIFNIKLAIIDDLIKNVNCVVDKKLFKKFILKLNNFNLTAFFKLSGISKSVILSYFFLEKKINIPDFFKLINLENKYQQNLCGYVDEQRNIDEYSLSTIKKISFFLKNVN